MERIDLSRTYALWTLESPYILGLCEPVGQMLLYTEGVS